MRNRAHYEKVQDNVFRMRPIGQKPRRKILTPFGRNVVALLLLGILLIIGIYGFYSAHRHAMELERSEDSR